MPKTPHIAIVDAAIAAGFPFVGLEVTREGWTASTTREIKARLDDAPIRLLDAEVLFLRPGETNDALLPALDIAAELGAQFVLTVSVDPDPDRNIRRFHALCDEAESRNLTIALEFMKFLAVGTLPDALEILNAADHASSALLLDTLHFNRCGYAPSKIAEINPGLLRYAQVCDGTKAPSGTDNEALVDDAVFGRRLPGEGDLPVREFVDALPSDIPLSLEIRSSQVYDQFPEPEDRARAIFDTTSRFL
ncbi:MAG: TIM barrel protein [Pseudomonadota bacterium]